MIGVEVFYELFVIKSDFFAKLRPLHVVFHEPYFKFLVSFHLGEHAVISKFRN